MKLQSAWHFHNLVINPEHKQVDKLYNKQVDLECSQVFPCWRANSAHTEFVFNLIICSPENWSLIEVAVTQEYSISEMPVFQLQFTCCEIAVDTATVGARVRHVTCFN